MADHPHDLVPDAWRGIPDTGARSLTVAADRVRRVNVEKGWFDGERSLDQSIGLIHTEIAEALEAYRMWGFDDATAVQTTPGVTAKPEGVGSELADVAVRFFDLAVREGIDLALVGDLSASTRGVQGGFIRGLNALHELAGKMLKAQHGLLLTAYAQRFWLQLENVAGESGVNLWAEFDRKVAYNATRPHRHGGKRL